MPFFFPEPRSAAISSSPILAIFPNRLILRMHGGMVSQNGRVPQRAGQDRKPSNALYLLHNIRYGPAACPMLL
jgi:hypothetical protein